ncbi:hypothetical protein DDB_G0283209 [Dictyostelium discoideum AX4]|uniref:Uncharacterized protein n=1 Tax=Dictyostelium discoideum TaxID=44689 RepID=Q54RE5_DICDI|nr:hypothetical protein DDB_G0283209 [Dictyostelium discoideum AX4]EAL65843.1 hypothetical protein DDB_G0283209 [Dictyostelium discoideum AX4]|eukprot:XP_639200.1 hypothetical protein DDB_G0283209 [Dictyostelium discoideum AX4]
MIFNSLTNILNKSSSLNNYNKNSKSLQINFDNKSKIQIYNPLGNQGGIGNLLVM